jgi:uncharacterized protein
MVERNDRRCTAFRRPSAGVYGSADRIVPPDQSRAVAAAAPGPTRLVEIEGANHNDPALLGGALLTAAVIDLADRCARARRSRRGMGMMPGHIG